MTFSNYYDLNLFPVFRTMSPTALSCNFHLLFTYHLLTPYEYFKCICSHYAQNLVCDIPFFPLLINKHPIETKLQLDAHTPYYHMPAVAASVPLLAAAGLDGVR